MGRGGQRAVQRHAKLRKAIGSVQRADCPEPDKVRYQYLSAARLAARAQGDKTLRAYPCGRHYHLTSRA